MTLRLRPYQIDDESAAVAAHEAMLADNFHFLLGWDPTLPWSDFLALLEEERLGLNLGENKVRAVQLVADADGELVGRVSIRFSLNEFLRERGGHVGYGVVPPQRRKGYASQILRQSLDILRQDDVHEVLVTCDDSNVGSRLVIERAGGVYESTLPASGDDDAIRRYWIGRTGL